MTTTSHVQPAATAAGSAAHLRPSAHFTARDTWLNDPNGLLHHDGVYHLFFQTNPHGSTWGHMSWGHATSTDLVTWHEHPVALPHTAEEEVFSGSAVADVRNTAGFAGPGQTALVAVYTSAYTSASDRPGIQAQSLAYSLDGGDTWTRHAGNPVLDTGSGEFRDPKVFWHGGDDGRWVMVAVEAVDRRVVVYSSPNLTDWTFESDFGPAHAVGGVWECPDLFPLTVEGTGETRWVLVVSLNPGGVAGGSGAQYFVGDFDGHTFTADRLSASTDPRDHDWLDHGRDYYAAVSFNDAPDGRRLTVGWASNWDYANDTPTGPWRSAMSLVRELGLVRCADGRLRVTQRPVLPPDGAGVQVVDLRVPSAPGMRTDVVLSTAPGAGTSRVTLTVDGGTRTLALDRTRSGATDFHPLFPSVDTAPLLGDDVTDLRIVVDGCVLEVYADGGLVTLTQLVFPDAPLTQVEVRTAAPRKPVVGAESAASFLEISQPRLRQLVDEGRIAVVRLGRVIAYPTDELERVRAERTGDARSTAVAQLLGAPDEPLRLTHDTVLRVSLTQSLDDETFHVRVWSGPDRQVVLVSPAGSTRYVSQPRIEDIMTSIDERLLGGAGGAAAWFTLDYDEGLTGTTLDVSNVVALVGPTRAGERGSPNRPSRFTRPSWTASGLDEVRRVAGCGPITVFPVGGNDSWVVEQHARTGEVVRVETDRYELARYMRALRTITADSHGDERTADDAATLLAHTLHLRADQLTAEVDDGRWYDGHIIDEPSTATSAVMGAVLTPTRLSPTERDLVEQCLRHRDVPRGDRLERLLTAVRAWQEGIDGWSDRPDPRLLDALGHVADLAAHALRNEVWSSDDPDTASDRLERFLAYPRWRPTFCDVVGGYDAAYLDTLTEVGADGRDHRILSSEVERSGYLFQHERDAWTYGRDRDGRLVAQAQRASGTGVFATLWPIDPPTAGMPDDAMIVSDGEAGDRPAYLAYPDGTMRLLPRRPGVTGQWNFGYGGGGPGELAAAIVEAYSVARRVSRTLVPSHWVRDAVHHSSQERFQMSVADITRRLNRGGSAD